MKYAKEIGIGLAVIALGGAWVLLSQQDIGPAEQPAAGEAAPAEQAAAPAEDPLSIEKRFETLLNEFLTSVNDRVQAYKSERKILPDLVKAENLRDVSYVEQNHQVMKATIPALRQKIDELMLTFEQTEAEVQVLLRDQPPGTVAVVNARWQELKKQQASLYVDFFAVEEEIMTAYQQLMDHYYARKDAFHVDPVTLSLTFSNPEDEAAAVAIRARLTQLAQKEAAILKSQNP